MCYGSTYNTITTRKNKYWPKTDKCSFCNMFYFKSGAIYGSVSCSRMLWCAGGGARDLNQQPSNCYTTPPALPSELQPPPKSKVLFNSWLHVSVPVPVMWWLTAEGEKVSVSVGGRAGRGRTTKSQFITNQALKSVLIFGRFSTAARLWSAFTFPWRLSAARRHMACLQMKVYAQPQSVLDACQLFAQSRWHQMATDT